MLQNVTLPCTFIHAQEPDYITESVHKLLANKLTWTTTPIQTWTHAKLFLN
jgi:hypothetical protein